VKHPFLFFPPFEIRDLSIVPVPHFFKVILQVVPNFPGLLIDCPESSAKARDDIMMELRISMPLVLSHHRTDSPSMDLRQRAEVFRAIPAKPHDAVLHITPPPPTGPNVTSLAEFVQKRNPVAIPKSARNLFSPQTLPRTHFS
jgi:hypothetical protein